LPWLRARRRIHGHRKPFELKELGIDGLGQETRKLSSPLVFVWQDERITPAFTLISEETH